MRSEIAIWQEQLNLRPDLSAKTIALYAQDARSLCHLVATGAPWSQSDRGHTH